MCKVTEEFMFFNSKYFPPPPKKIDIFLEIFNSEHYNLDQFSNASLRTNVTFQQLTNYSIIFTFINKMNKKNIKFSASTFFWGGFFFFFGFSSENKFKVNTFLINHGCFKLVKINKL